MKKASDLKQMSACLSLEPIAPGDQRYTDLSGSHTSDELIHLRLHLRNVINQDNRYAKIILNGYRGSGKSTELLHLSELLKDQYTVLYLPLSNHILRDCDHVDLIIWIVEYLIKHSSEQKWPLNADTIIRITDWFSRKGFENYETIKDEIRSEAGTDFQATYGFYWMPVLLLNRIKSMMIASSSHRQLMRKRFHTYTTEMIFYTNSLLLELRKSLAQIAKPCELLLLIDNLDHLPVAAGQTFFFDSADIIKELKLHLVLTASYALTLPPYPIQNSLPDCFTFPLISKSNNDHSDSHPEKDGMLNLLAQRIDIDRIFTAKPIIHYLINMSGGIIRDLLMLVNHAQLHARAGNKSSIDWENAESAVLRLQSYYEKLLTPQEIYYPLLAKIYLHQQEHFILDDNRTTSGVHDARFFAGELLNSGVLLTNHDPVIHYEVHPIIPSIPSFAPYWQEVQKTISNTKTLATKRKSVKKPKS